MQINEETAQQFLDAINDYVSNGDIEIDAITPSEAGNLYRSEMDCFLLQLMAQVLQLKEAK